MSEPLFDQSQADINRGPLDDPRILSGPYWSELRVFLAVAKIKSFNKAGSALSMSRNKVSRAIQHLQDTMGAVLLVSSNSGIQLTDKGKELASKLISVDQMLYSMSNDLKAEAREAEGLVRVTATEAMTGFFIIPNHVSFSHQYPKIFTRFSTPVNLLNFRENQCDVMVGFGPLKDPDLETRPAGFLHLIGTASQPYIEEFGVPTAETLSKHRFIDAGYYASQTPAYASWRDAVSRGTVAHHCDNPYNYALMVKAGLGIGLLGNFVLIDREFIPVGMGIHVKLPIYIHALTERLRSRPVRIVFDWLTEVFSPSNSWFGPQLSLDGFPRAVSQSFQHLSSGSNRSGNL